LRTWREPATGETAARGTATGFASTTRLRTTNCITALCHPATYWMTGNTLHVDGGENVVG